MHGIPSLATSECMAVNCEPLTRVVVTGFPFRFATAPHDKIRNIHVMVKPATLARPRKALQGLVYYGAGTVIGWPFLLSQGRPQGVARAGLSTDTIRARALSKQSKPHLPTAPCRSPLTAGWCFGEIISSLQEL